MKKAAIIPCRGLGDGIILSQVAGFLKQEGHAVTIYHDALLSLTLWLPDFSIRPESEIEMGCERIFYQNENAPRAKDFYNRDNVTILYHSHEPDKHPAIRSQDIYIGTDRPIAKQLAAALHTPCKSGLTPPSHLIHRKYKKRIAIHPTSADPKRNWPKERFLELARLLQARGFSPYFVMSAKERESWGEESAPYLPTLSDTAAFLFESDGFIGNDSGLGHLASALHIPTVTLSNRYDHIALWRPSFYANEVTLPSRLFPKRYREENWKKLISPKKVLHKFLNISFQ